MPRANRQFAHHRLWHITHRCHKREFLLKFARDRRFWRMCLFEARRRYGISVLNYIATSNHVHIMVDSRDGGSVPAAMRFVSGRTAQNFNRRKARRGAFWEDRYHATPIETQAHFFECLVYVDLNMVRAGVVAHPAAWPWSGYDELQSGRRRYRILDTRRLVEIAGVSDLAEYRTTHAGWVAERLAAGDLVREARWTQTGGQADVS